VLETEGGNLARNPIISIPIDASQLNTKVLAYLLRSSDALIELLGSADVTIGVHTSLSKISLVWSHDNTPVCLMRLLLPGRIKIKLIKRTETEGVIGQRDFDVLVNLKILPRPLPFLLLESVLYSDHSMRIILKLVNPM
jgi:hypothetical protein